MRTDSTDRERPKHSAFGIDRTRTCISCFLAAWRVLKPGNNHYRCALLTLTQMSIDDNEQIHSISPADERALRCNFVARQLVLRTCNLRFIFSGSEPVIPSDVNRFPDCAFPVYLLNLVERDFPNYVQTKKSARYG